MISNKRLATEYHETLSQKGIMTEDQLLINYGFIAEYPTNLDQIFLNQGHIRGIGLEKKLDNTSINILKSLLKKKR